MPGFNRTGPNGMGAMTGKGLGQCGVRGRQAGYGMGMGRGLGRGRGAGRGAAFSQQGWNVAISPQSSLEPAQEIELLKAQAEEMQSALQEINNRIKELNTESAL